MASYGGFNMEAMSPVSSLSGEFDVDGSIREVWRSAQWPAWIEPYKVRKFAELPIQPLIHDWITSGIPAAEVVRKIKDHGFFVNDKTEHVLSDLSHYRATIPKSAIVSRVYPNAVSRVYKQLTPMRKQMERVDEIIEMQWDSVQRAKRASDMMQEMNGDMIGPMAELGKEMDRYVSLVEANYKLRERLGFTDKQLEELAGRADDLGIDLDKIYGKSGINDRIKDPMSRAKILGTIERLFDVIKMKTAKGENFDFNEIIDVPAYDMNGVSGSFVSGVDIIDVPMVVASGVDSQVEVIEQIDLSTLSESDFIKDYGDGSSV